LKISRKQALCLVVACVIIGVLLSILVFPIQWQIWYAIIASILANVLGVLATNLLLLVEALGLLFLPAVINWGIQPLFIPLVVDIRSEQLFAYNSKQTLFNTEENIGVSEYCLRSRLILVVKPPLVPLFKRVTYLLAGRFVIRKIDPHTSFIAAGYSKHGEDWALNLDVHISGFRLSRCRVDVICDESTAPDVVIDIGEPTFSSSRFEATRTVVVTNIESFSVRGFVTEISLSEDEGKLLNRQVLMDGQPLAVDRVVEKGNSMRVLLDLDRLQRRVLTLHLRSESE
jgi:hypothetical protein